MRTQEQSTHRYFRALWSVFLLILIVSSVFVVAWPQPMPDWAIIAWASLSSVGSAVIGFLHGITIFVARQNDAELEATHVEVME